LAPTLSDRELVTGMPSLVRAERTASADVIAHLAEIDRRQLYFGEACSSSFAYCRERLGYSEDEALKRVRVARLAQKLPTVLDELRSGAIHLTGLFVLSNYLTAENADALLVEARGKSRRELERLLARHFPRPDVAERVVPIAGTGAGNVSAGIGMGSVVSEGGAGSVVACPGTGGNEFRGRVEPLSASGYRVEFTASSEFCDKLERARALLSHSLPSAELATLLERALDALIAREVHRRTGAGKPRKRRELQLGSRHVPVEVARVVWERDGARCAFVDSEGRRCSARRFLTLEHRIPHGLGGASTVENVCLLCSGHNGYTAREVYGAAYVARKRAERASARKRAERVSACKRAEPIEPTTSAIEQARFALCRLGFGRAEVARVLALLDVESAELDAAGLVRAALVHLTPKQVSGRSASSFGSATSCG
jgi:hypothetical protein